MSIPPFTERQSRRRFLDPSTQASEYLRLFYALLPIRVAPHDQLLDYKPIMVASELNRDVRYATGDSGTELVCQFLITSSEKRQHYISTFSTFLVIDLERMDDLYSLDGVQMYGCYRVSKDYQLAINLLSYAISGVEFESPKLCRMIDRMMVMMMRGALASMHDLMKRQLG